MRALNCTRFWKFYINAIIKIKIKWVIISFNKIFYGSWGTKPFENDGALDLKDEWEESGNLSVLEYALDTIMANKEDSVIDAIDAEAAIASANIIVNINDDLSSKLLENY